MLFLCFTCRSDGAKVLYITFFYKHFTPTGLFFKKTKVLPFFELCSPKAVSPPPVVIWIIRRIISFFNYRPKVYFFDINQWIGIFYFVQRKNSFSLNFSSNRNDSSFGKYVYIQVTDVERQKPPFRFVYIFGLPTETCWTL